MTSHAKKTVIVVTLTLLIGATVIVSMSRFLVYQHNQATRAGNEAAVIQTLKTISAVEIQYFNTHKRTFGTIDQLVSEWMLSSKFAGNPVIADGYVFDLKLSGGPQSSYVLTADPRDDSSGRNHFYLDSTSAKIHINSDVRASASDPTN